MPNVLIETLSSFFMLTNPAANSTASSFASRLPKTTTPSGDGIIGFGSGGSVASNGLLVVPLGVGSDTNTFSMNVWGWREIQGLQGSQGLATLWVPVLLAGFTSCELDSGLPGIVNTQVPATEYFCSAMTLGVGNSGISVEVVSPGHGSGSIAHAVIDCKGFRFVEVGFSIASGGTTSMNALWAKL